MRHKGEKAKVCLPALQPRPSWSLILRQSLQPVSPPALNLVLISYSSNCSCCLSRRLEYLVPPANCISAVIALLLDIPCIIAMPAIYLKGHGSMRCMILCFCRGCKGKAGGQRQWHKEGKLGSPAHGAGREL